MARIDAELKAHGKRYEIVTYPDVGHAFFRESSQKMEAPEIADAWTRVKSFLAAHLA